MTATRCISWTCLVTLALTAHVVNVACGVERFPPPDFTHHTLPLEQYPPAQPWATEYVAVALLAGALALASYLALVRRSRRGIFLLAITSLAVFGFWREGCVCSIGAIQNVTLALFDSTYIVPAVVVAFFILPLLFTLFFGRTFCAAVCPLGAIQELVVLRPVRVPRWLEEALGLIPYVYLGAAVVLAADGTAFLICRYDPFVNFFRFAGSLNILIFGGCLLLVGVFVGRPYCRFLCPYGAILGMLSRVSKWKVQIPPEECIRCRLCEDACPYGAIREPTVPQGTGERRVGRRRLTILLLLVPAWIVLGLILGRGLSASLGQLNPTVRLADRIRLEAEGKVQGTIDASDAFRNTGRSPEDLDRDARHLRAHLGFAGSWLGAWVGLVIGLKFVHLSIRRRRADYQPDRANCVACGRCFQYCPAEQARRGLIRDVE